MIATTSSGRVHSATRRPSYLDVAGVKTATIERVADALTRRAATAPRIARRAGVSSPTALRALDRLVDAGRAEVAGKSGRATTFRAACPEVRPSGTDGCPTYPSRRPGGRRAEMLDAVLRDLWEDPTPRTAGEITRSIAATGYRVSNSNINASLGRLAAEGRVVREIGKGSYPTYRLASQGAPGEAAADDRPKLRLARIESLEARVAALEDTLARKES